jgi:hypothetical protein
MAGKLLGWVAVPLENDLLPVNCRRRGKQVLVRVEEVRELRIIDCPACARREIASGSRRGNPHPAYVDALYPSFPKQFVVTLTQTGTSLTGTISGSGLSAHFPSPGAGAANIVSNPRKVNLGVEGRYNVWAPGDGDNYFHLAADDTLTSMSGSGQYCISSVAHRR